MTTTRIVIVGGGFGGLYTALNLCQFPWTDANRPDILLLNDERHFLFAPLLYELITGEMQSWEVAPPYEDLLADTPIRFQQAYVQGVDLVQRRVEVGNESISADYLVLAVGGETQRPPIPGLPDHAYEFRTLVDAERLRERLRFLLSGTGVVRVVIVGAGPSGIELACKLADQLGNRGRVRLVDRGTEILKTFSPFAREAAEKALERRGIWLNLATTVTEITANTITLNYKDQLDVLPVDVVVWTAGTRTPQWVVDLPAQHDDQGRLVVRPTLQLPEYPQVLALGDVAACVDEQGQVIPRTAQAAFQQADYAAWNLWALITGRSLLPFKYFHLGEMLTLGTEDAALSGLGVQLQGPLAYIARRLVYLWRLPTLKHRLQVGWHWMMTPWLDWVTTVMSSQR
ncbi:MAG: NAD(P)/FAD-dependent oxidoreductase [Gloeomargarita sp. HHBFW_bins_162]